jgi:digeranylgeranylglycerophospholipid reductase
MDVAVVGGGPAGLLLAARCAEAGLDVLVFEEHRDIGEPVHCTGVISLETAELVKLAGDIILKRVRRARLWPPSGRAVDIVWDGGWREQILAIDRGALDRSLAAQAREAGAVIATGARVSSISIGEDGVDVAAGDHRVRARACALACGVCYRFQRRLGLGLPGRFLHTAQLEVDAVAADSIDLHVGRRVAPDGFAWVVPVRRAGRDRLKIGVMANGDAGACLDRLLARADLRQRLLADPGAPVRRLVPLGPIGKTYAERLLVIGDAGGLTKPTTGGGIFYGLLTACLAADTLIEGFQQGRLDEGFLSRYERRWQERLGPELRVAGWFRYLLTRLTDPEIDALVRALARHDLQALLHATGRFNWHRDLILALVRQRELSGLLLRTLMR